MAKSTKRKYTKRPVKKSTKRKYAKRSAKKSTKQRAIKKSIKAPKVARSRVASARPPVICLFAKVRAYLHNNEVPERFVLSTNLTNSMINHIKKAMMDEYPFFDNGKGKAKVSVTFSRPDRLFYVRICGAYRMTYDFSIDEDGNEPYDGMLIFTETIEVKMELI